VQQLVEPDTFSQIIIIERFSPPLIKYFSPMCLKAGLENFQDKLCFQGKRKLLKNPE